MSKIILVGQMVVKTCTRGGRSQDMEYKEGLVKRMAEC
jgi:hypothetical protein